jgi:hypothetical protein
MRSEGHFDGEDFGSARESMICSSVVWPTCVAIIDDKHVRMAVPGRVCKMRVIGRQIGMFMFDDLRVFRGPHQQCSCDPNEGKDGENQRGGRHPSRSAEPARQRIG